MFNFGNIEFTSSSPENRRPWAVVDDKLVTSDKSKVILEKKNFGDYYYYKYFGKY